MNTLISFKIELEDLRKIQEIAIKENRSRSNLIKIAIKEFLKNNGKQ